MPGLQQRRAVGEGQVLDAERAGQPEDDASAVLGAPQVGVVIGGSHVVGGFAAEDQGPAVEPRRLPACAQRLEELAGPQMLVDVDPVGPEGTGIEGTGIEGWVVNGVDGSGVEGLQGFWCWRDGIHRIPFDGPRVHWEWAADAEVR